MKKLVPLLLALPLALTGCKGLQRNLAVVGASTFGADWVIAQDNMEGNVARCWIIRNQSVDNEGNSDGIHWLDQTTGHLIHISGWYNRVQVSHGDFSRAGHFIGVEDVSKCIQ